MSIRTLVKEPLIHFLVAAGVLFGAYGWVDRGATRDAATDSRTVRITAGEVAWLTETWARQRQREPDEAELKGLLADYLREELLAREARELRLDENDVVVRRRLAQKMTFLFEDTVRAAEPTEEEARRIYEASPERFRTPARISLRQIYFDPQRRGHDAAVVDATSALRELSKPGATAEGEEHGDRSLLERELTDADQQGVASVFGPEFARAVFALSPGRWHGPIESGYGLHLVRVVDVEKGRARSFAEVRADVIEEWRRQTQKTSDERYFAGLLGKYHVVTDDSRVERLLGPLATAAAGRS